MKIKQNTKRKKLKREIEKRKFPFVTTQDMKTGKITVHPLISN